jgi:ATP-binding cassette subfamily C protein
MFRAGVKISRRKRKSRSNIWRIAAAMPPGRSLLVLLCLLGSGAAEGIGIASLVPLIAVAGNSGVTGKSSVIAAYVTHVLGAIGLPNTPLSLLVLLALGLIGKALLSMLAMHQVGHAVAEVGTRMRMDLISALLAARWGFFVREPMGRFSNALGLEALSASEAYSAVAQLLSHVIQALIYLLIAAAFSWKLALLAAAIGGVMMLMLSRFIVVTRRQARKQTRQTKLMIVRLADVLMGLKPMKAMGRQARFASLFAKDVNAIDRAMRRQFFAKHANRILQEPILFLCIGIGVYAALVTSIMPLAELMIMSVLLLKTVTVIGRVQEDLQAVGVAESGYAAIRGVIDDAAAAREETNLGRRPTLAQGIEISHVAMTFGGKPIIEDASFTVPAGGVTAILGASGAGKTTLVDLMLGLHQPTGGRILIDGVPLLELDIMMWRSMVGYVPQELMLFHDSILANVSLGEPGFSRADVEHALHQAGAWGFVSQREGGMDHVVGERGAALSGGQRQRIALARALVHRPKLLILDEATSALDPVTEAQIIKNVRELADRDGITVLSISHQPAWMAVADRVIRMQDGRITEVTPPPAPRAISR